MRKADVDLLLNQLLDSHDNVSDSTVVICPTRVSMLPLDQAEFSDTDQGVCDGIADCGACAGGQRPRGGLPGPV